MNRLTDDSKTIHFGLRKNYSGYTSLCGNNSMNITIDGVVRRVYGGAKRSTDMNKVNCSDCLEYKTVFKK